MGQMPKDAPSMRQERRQEIVKNVKKLYASPALVEYGSLAKLTRGSGGTVGDAGAGSMVMCL